MSGAGGVLASSVTLRGENHGLVTFPVGSTPPAWAQSLITNPKAWKTAPESDAGDEQVTEPPRSGAGSGKDAWVAYAADLGVEHDQDATRDEIIAAVDASKE